MPPTSVTRLALLSPQHDVAYPGSLTVRLIDRRRRGSDKGMHIWRRVVRRGDNAGVTFDPHLHVHNGHQDSHVEIIGDAVCGRQGQEVYTDIDVKRDQDDVELEAFTCVGTAERIRLMFGCDTDVT